MGIRLATLISITLSIHASARGYSQNVTFSGKDVSLQTVFASIEKQTGVSFFFNYALLKDSKPVSLDVHDMPLEDVLHRVLDGEGLSFYRSSKTIFIVKSQTGNGSLVRQARAALEITGVVQTENGHPLEGASVELKELNLKGQTDRNGQFEFKGLRAGRFTLVITYIGYEKYWHEVEISNNSVLLPIILKTSSSSLDQVQVIAYGTTTERLNVGSVTTVKSAELEKQPVTNPLLAIQALVPGMEITQSVGLPGSVVTVMIRGQSSISHATVPLYVVDGVPYPSQGLPGVSFLSLLGDASTGNPLSFLNIGDIESIDILKDAAATAIYGSQGANGVVLITTKKGKPGKTRVELQAQTGFGQVPEKLKLLNTRQYLDMRYEAFKNDKAAPNPSSDYDLTLWDTTRQTDWQKILLGRMAQYTAIDASIGGGNANTSFTFNGNYQKQTSIFPGSYNLKRASGHLAVNNVSPDKKFMVSFAGSYSISNNDLPGFDPTAAAVELAPDAPPLYKPDGSINWAPNSNGVSTWPTSSSNPYAVLSALFDAKTYNFISTATISYELLPGLVLMSSQGYGNLQSNSYTGVPWSSIDPSAWNANPRRAAFSETNNQNWTIDPRITYTGKLFTGKVEALAGMTLQNNKETGSSYIATGFPSDQLIQDITFATNVTAGFALNNTIRYNAGFGRLNYNWHDKYLLDLSARRDGNSSFGPANRFHNFYAIGVGWLFYKNEFAQKHFSSLSYGKLRGSWGTTGNGSGQAYAYLDPYTIIPVGVSYQGGVGLASAQPFNPNLEWEETRKSDVGLELGFFRDRILINANFYRNVSSNQLINYPLPDITGFSSIYQNFNAKLENYGWEFELRTKNIESKDFHWSSSLNLSVNRNKLISGAPGLSAFYQRLMGHPVNAGYYFHSLGVNPITGIYQYADSHGGATYSPNPATDLNTLFDPNRKYYGGFSNTFSYKNVQLSFTFYFVRHPQQNIYLFNSIPGSFNSLNGTNQPVDVLSRWRQPGDVSRIEKFNQDYSIASSRTYLNQSDLLLGDASFIRLQNVSLSWRLPEVQLKKMNLQDFTVFVHGQNVLTITKYEGLDPETGSSYIPYLPPLRIVTFGAKVDL